MVSQGAAGRVDAPHDETAQPAEAPRPWGRRRRLLVTLALIAVAGVGLGQLYLTVDDSRGQQGGASQQGATTAARTVTEFPPADRGSPVDVTGSTLAGDQFSMEELRGRVVVVNVWGSWCPPCREEAPVLADVSRRYADRGVSFVGVNVRDNPAAARAFERRYGITYPSIEDSAGRALLALNQYIPANAVPVTLVLDRQGRVAARVLGALEKSTLTALLDSVLAEPPLDGQARDTS